LVIVFHLVIGAWLLEFIWLLVLGDWLFLKLLSAFSSQPFFWLLTAKELTANG